ncbi:MAG: NifB/NifX family molybdenum-iron cluster-binding protein [Evtepia gabavorous]
MKLAIPYDNGQVFQHFGKTEAFKIYDIVDGKVGPSMVMSTNGQGHGALAGLLRAGHQRRDLRRHWPWGH